MTFQKDHIVSEETREKMSLKKIEYFKTHIHPLKGTKRPNLHHEKQFKKGQIPWNKGMKGYYTSRRGKKCPKQSGVNHYNWKGGISYERKRIYQSIEYRLWRLAVFERDKFTCQDCGKHGVYLEAHHIKSFVDYPEFRFELSNGRTLCNKCHNKTKRKANKGR